MSTVESEIAEPVGGPAASGTDRWDRAVALAPHVGVVVLVVALVMQPMLATSREYGQDWANHLWLIWKQGAAWSEEGAPTLFLNADPMGAFYPMFAFYGGTLYAVGGLLSSVLNGSAVVAYLAMWIFALLMAYLGLGWLAWQAGVRGLRLHVAPVIYLTAASVVSNIFVRGVLPEFTATSALMLVLAAGVDLLRSRRIRPWSVAAFVVATVFFTGSHNISTLWGTIALALLLVPAWWAVGLGAVDWRRVGVLAGLGILAVGVNAWFLLPNVVLQGATSIAQEPKLYKGVLDILGEAGILFSINRDAPLPAGSLYTQLPTLALIWIALSVLAVRRHEGRPWRRLMIGTTAILAIFVCLMLFWWPWQILPSLFDYIQFPYRVGTYALLMIAILAIGALRVAKLGPLQRVRVVLLVLALGSAAYSTLLQSWTAPLAGLDHTATFAGGLHKLPPTWNEGGNYRNGTMREIPPGDVTSTMVFPPGGIEDGRITVRLPRRPGQVIQTNLAADAELVTVIGATRIGRTPGHFESGNTAGFAILRPEPGATSITLERNTGGVVAAGRVVTLASVLALLGLLVLWAAKVVRARRKLGPGAVGSAPAEGPGAS